MKTSSGLLSALLLCLAQNMSPATAAEPSGKLIVASNDERNGCCLTRVESNSGAIWEYTNDTSFRNCYLWSKLIGNPFQFPQDRKYEFHRDRKCHLIKSYDELTPSPYSIQGGNG